ncbi:winged helix DNA-binding domain-containing protein [Actinacidiphila soli]|uniref:winged helix DNA-binding domain-containing protein n=1 Tax=Actinacidiphila soli TaxID=2487275 RepID=UPI001F0BCA20|nr:winged helix DNA-binding domain-containing protein [Actinacidiphila soli]
MPDVAFPVASTRVAGEVLSLQDLTRATLARQLLLQRSPMTAPEAIAHLLGLQSQVPSPPYQGLWTRLTDFDLKTLTDLMTDRAVVRSTLMRYTLHLIGAADYDWLRPTLQPVMDRAQQSFFGRRTKGLDLGELVAFGREALSGRELTLVELRGLLGERWPELDPIALGYSVQYLVPVVHVPPCGTWKKGGGVRMALAEDWFGAPVAGRPDRAELVRRYLAAFGPASVRDVQAWSGLPRLADLLESMRPELVVFSNEAGVEMFDLPDAPHPGADTPTPVRFLPAYDNLMVAYTDRSRVLTEEQRKVITSGAGGRTRTRPGQQGAVAATLLVDGRVRATWKIERVKRNATLVVEPFEPMTRQEKAEAAAEAEQLLLFSEPDAQGAVEFV